MPSDSRPTFDELYEQVERLTSALARLRAEVTELRDEFRSVIPKGWRVPNLSFETNTSISVCRDCITGEYVVWDGSGNAVDRDMDLSRLLLRVEIPDASL